MAFKTVLPLALAALALASMAAAQTDEVTASSARIEDPVLAVTTSRRPAPRAPVPPDFAVRAAELRAAAFEEDLRLGLITRDPDFRAWIEDFRARASDAGISFRTLDRALTGLQLDEQILELDRNQAEFSRALWEYLDTAVSETRLRNGRDALAQWSETLAQIEDRYQVEAEVVVAVWGLESAYGAARGGTNVIEAMATLAFDGRRAAFFEAELMAALQILEARETIPRNMRGSWAGAMGHTQFMPSSYLEYAQDFTGDGRRDIWSENPTDALASTAHYLAAHGWTHGQPWGMEVRLPEGFDYRLAGVQERIDVRFWNGQGVRLVNGDPLPDHGPASILLPAGHRGVALVIYDNFRVIERYNTADAYVIAVGHLSDRIAGGPAFQAGWPREDRALGFEERQEMQEILQQMDLYGGNIDGLVGPITIDAVRAFQVQAGLVPDGYASAALLARLRQARGSAP